MGISLNAAGVHCHATDVSGSGSLPAQGSKLPYKAPLQELRVSLCEGLRPASIACLRTRVTILGLVAVAALLYAVKFSPHPIRWLIGLIVALLISAAIAGSLPQDKP